MAGRIIDERQNVNYILLQSLLIEVKTSRRVIGYLCHRYLQYLEERVSVCAGSADERRMLVGSSLSFSPCRHARMVL